MKVYVVQEYPGEIVVYSRRAALRIARAAAQHSSRVREYGDMRTDDEALEDFIIVHWAVETEVL